MTAAIILATYLVAGTLAALVALGREEPRDLRRAALALFLWPLLLAGTSARPASDRPRARRIEEVRRALASACERSGSIDARERATIERFLGRLGEKEARLGELEATLERAPPSIHPQLERLRASILAEVDAGLAIVEEMTAQLTLLRFADLGDSGVAASDRDRVESLLARIEALATVTAET